MARVHSGILQDPGQGSTLSGVSLTQTHQAAMFNAVRTLDDIVTSSLPDSS